MKVAALLILTSLVALILISAQDCERVRENGHWVVMCP